MESVRLWLVIQREKEGDPWSFTEHSKAELAKFGILHLLSAVFDAQKEKGTQEGP